MSISDVIRNKFVEEFTAISVGTLVTTMLLSFLLASCCMLEVVKGGAGSLRRSLLLTSVTVK